MNTRRDADIEISRKRLAAINAWQPDIFTTPTSESTPGPT